MLTLTLLFAERTHDTELQYHNMTFTLVMVIFALTYNNGNQLILSGCEALATLPDNIGSLVSLHSLTIMACRLVQELPMSITGLLQLTTLMISEEVGCLNNNTNTMHYIGKITTLTMLDLGPCKSDNFAASFRELVKMHKLLLPLISDCSTAMRHASAFLKITMIVTEMLNLQVLCLSHCIYVVLQDLQQLLQQMDTSNLSALFQCLQTYPRIRLTYVCLDENQVADASESCGHNFNTSAITSL